MSKSKSTKNPPGSPKCTAERLAHDMKDRLTLPVLAVIFFILAAGIVAVGCVHYQSQQETYRAGIEHKLTAIAALKTGEISLWRKERWADANVFYKNNAFAALVRRYFQRPEDLDLQKDLRTWLSHFQATNQYSRFALLDAQSNERMSSPDTREPLSSVIKQKLPDTLRSGQITFVDFYRDEYSQKIHLGLLVPVLDGQDGDRPIGVLSLKIDPRIYLYPFIQLWPTPSETAETLLIRREGNEAVFLDELKFRKNAAITFHISLDRQDNPAVMAVLGQKGIVEGVDYRGIPVFASVQAVPDSPWYLEARMDAAEVYAPMRERLWTTVLLVAPC